MSKERAARRAARQAEQQRASLDRQRRTARQRRRRRVQAGLAAPFRWVGSRARRTAASFGRRTKAQRVVLLGALIVVVGALALAPSWGLKIALVGLTALLLPVAWTVASGRR